MGNESQPSTPIGVVLRNSTEDQAQRQTIDRQRHAIREWISHHPEYEIVEWYEDEGVSGTVALNKRPAGRRLIEDVRAGRLKLVVLTSLDRLGRTLQVIVDGYRLLESQGVGVHVLDSPLGTIDTSTPMGKFAFHLLAIVAELERDLIVDRSRSMQTIRTKEGRWMGGYVPFGYDIKDGFLAVNETEARVVREIFHRILSGEAMESVARDLKRRGLRAPRKKKDGTQKFYDWTGSRIQQMFERPTYAGEHLVGDITQEIPALIQRDQWERFKSRRRLRGSVLDSERDTGLLSAVFRCSLCGRPYYFWDTGHRAQGGKYRYYACYNASTTPSNQNTYSRYHTRCKAKLIDQMWLDQAVLEQVDQRMRNPTPWIMQAMRRDEERSGVLEDLGEQEKALLAQIGEVDSARSRLLDAYTRGKVPMDLFDRQEGTLRSEADELETQLRLVQFKVMEQGEARDTEQEVLNLIQDIRERWEKLSEPELKLFLRKIVRSAWIKTLNPDGGRKKRAEIDIQFVFDEPVMAALHPEVEDDDLYQSSVSALPPSPATLISWSLSLSAPPLDKSGKAA